jgi:hypothetical protein
MIAAMDRHARQRLKARISNAFWTLLFLGGFTWFMVVAWQRWLGPWLREMQSALP